MLAVAPQPKVPPISRESELPEGCNGGTRTVNQTHFFRIPKNVLNLEPSLWPSSGVGVSTVGGGVDDDMVKSSISSLRESDKGGKVSRKYVDWGLRDGYSAVVGR